MMEQQPRREERTLRTLFAIGLLATLLLEIASGAKQSQVLQDRAAIAHYNPTTQPASLLAMEEQQLEGDEQALGNLEDLLFASLALDGVTAAALIVRAVRPPNQQH